MISSMQRLQGEDEVIQQRFVVIGSADCETHALLHVRRLGKGAEVEADDGALQPVLGTGNHFIVGLACHAMRLAALKSRHA